MFNGFTGGLWLDLKKKPAVDRPVEPLEAPSKLYIPLRQCKGSTPEFIIREGSRVRMGEPIATGGACDIHSPVSGRVLEIRPSDHPISGMGLMAVIENNGKDTPYEQPAAPRNLSKLPKEEILAAIRKAAVISTGGLDTPLAQRLNDMCGKHIDTLVINAVETEPYICTAEKLLSESPEKISKALVFLLKITGAKKAILAVSDDFDHGSVKDMIESAHLEGIELKLSRIRQKYPSGYSALLYRLLTGKKLLPGKDPESEGIGFVSVEELYETYKAVVEAQPQITRIVTVAGGAVENPQNLEVRIGTPVHDVLEHCGLKYDPERVVLGSIMRGVAIADMNTPIVKPVSAVLALTEKKAGAVHPLCVNCGRCAKVCPQRLLPNYIAMLAIKADFDACSMLHIQDCIECGSCAYICPGRMPLVELIKNIKKAAQTADDGGKRI